MQKNQPPTLIPNAQKAMMSSSTKRFLASSNPLVFGTTMSKTNSPPLEFDNQTLMKLISFDKTAIIMSPL